MDLSDHEITDFFASVTPQDLIGDTAFFSRPAPPNGVTFNGFLNEHLDVLRVAFASCDGKIYPIVTLLADDVAYYFKAEDKETLGAFIDRVSLFSKSHGAEMMFIFRRSKATVEGEELQGVYWLAGHKQPDTSTHYRHGYFEISGQVLGECVEAPLDGLPIRFTEILD